MINSSPLHTHTFTHTHTHTYTHTHTHTHIHTHVYTHANISMWPALAIWWRRLVGSFKWYVSFAKEPYKRDYILQKRPIILRSLLIVATPYLCFRFFVTVKESFVKIPIIFLTFPDIERVGDQNSVFFCWHLLTSKESFVKIPIRVDKRLFRCQQMSAKNGSLGWLSLLQCVAECCMCCMCCIMMHYVVEWIESRM